MNRKCQKCGQGEMIENYHLSTDDYPVEICSNSACRNVETCNIGSKWMKVKGPINWAERCPSCGITALEEGDHFSFSDHAEKGAIQGGERGWGGCLI